MANDPQMKGKVKFLAVAAGNNQTEVDSFRAEKKVPFPIIPDPKFLAYEAVGDPGATPFTLVVRKTDSGARRDPGQGRARRETRSSS